MGIPVASLPLLQFHHCISWILCHTLSAEPGTQSLHLTNRKCLSNDRVVTLPPDLGSACEEAPGQAFPLLLPLLLGLGSSRNLCFEVCPVYTVQSSGVSAPLDTKRVSGVPRGLQEPRCSVQNHSWLLLKACPLGPCLSIGTHWSHLAPLSVGTGGPSLMVSLLNTLVLSFLCSCSEELIENLWGFQRQTPGLGPRMFPWLLSLCRKCQPVLTWDCPPPCPFPAPQPSSWPHLAFWASPSDLMRGHFTAIPTFPASEQVMGAFLV